RLAVPDLHVVVVVVKHGRVLAHRDDRVIAPPAPPALPELPLEQAVQVVLVHARPTRLHAGEVTFAGQLDRLANRVQLTRLLSQAELVDDLTRILDAGRRIHAGAGARAQRVQQLRDPGVELRVVRSEERRVGPEWRSRGLVA